MGTIKLVPPHLGLNDNLAYSDQPTETTRAAQNTRAVDPKTQRRRIAQRAGLTKLVSSGVDASGSKVTRIDYVTVHNPLVTYAEHTDPNINTQWGNVTPSKTDSLGGVIDRQSNVYALDGNTGVVKYNSKGEEVYRIALPATDSSHLVRAIHVNPFDELFFGVSEGGDQKKAKLWKYVQLPDAEVALSWTIDTELYVEQIKTFKDKLYTLQNDVSQGRAFVVVYDGTFTANPFETQRWEVAFPAHDLDVSEEGAIYVASEEALREPLVYIRGPNPKSPTTYPTVVDWTPLDLTDADKRIWSWYDAEEITELDVAGEYRNQVRMVIWRDKSGNDRHLFANSIDPVDVPDGGPRLSLNGLSGKPTVSFNGDEGLVSGPNQSEDETMADQQKTIVPMYDDGATSGRGPAAMWALFLVIRPAKESESGNLPRVLFSQENNSQAGTATAEDHLLLANCNSDAVPVLNQNFEDGALQYYTKTDQTDPGAGTGRQPLHSASGFDNVSSGAIITIICDGGVNSGDSSTSATRSLWRVNGEPIDRWEGLGIASRSATRLGNPGAASRGTGCDDYIGDIAEIICLTKYQDTVGSEILEHQKFPDGSSGEDQTDNELTRIEGYLAHKWGLSHLLQTDSDTWPHPYGITGSTRSPLGPPPDGELGDAAATIQAYACVAKYTTAGELKWTYNNNDGRGFDTGTSGGGIGRGVKAGKDGAVFCLGKRTITGVATAGQVAIRKLIDLGDTVSDSSADGAWRGAASLVTQDYTYPRMDVDKFNNVYVPYHNTSGKAFSLVVYQETGSSGTGVIRASYLLSASQQAHAVAIDPNIPDYLDSGVEIAEYVYLFTNNEADVTNATVHKVELVSKTKITGSPRSTVVLAATRNGDIKKIDRAADTVSAITGGGAGTLSANSQFVDSVSAFERIFFTDGQSYKLYDGRAGHDEIVDWEATSAGQLIERAEFVDLWGSRIVLARFADDPQNYLLLKAGDPFDADLFPTAGLVPGQAVAGTTAGGAGPCPDVINSIAPITDDVLLFGCDHSIWALRGDPTQGGSFDKISDSVGMAYGRSWCKDDADNVFFFGSRGGLYVVNPSGQLNWLSENNIDKRLQSVDFSAYHVELVYNHTDHGVHIFLIPFAAHATAAQTHWFFEIRSGIVSPWEDKFGNNTTLGIQPTAAQVIDGDDPDDRLLVLGCDDSKLRKWDLDAKDDDGTPIDSYITWGPLVPMSQEREFKFYKLGVELADDQHGLVWELFASQEADDIGQRVKSGRLRPGVNPFIYDRVVGPNAWLRFRNANAGERWAFENGTIDVFPGGRRRVRVR